MANKIVLTDEMKEDIVNCSALGYTTARTAIVVSPSKPEAILKELETEGTEAHKLFENGKILADYTIDLKVFDLARMGDAKSIEKLESIRHRRRHD